jgi:NAD(P)-dependent dehydrogenase (short-subunit alcohol dehydrogenase family)
MLSLEGKKVLIVGGSTGMGLGTAKLVAAAGAKVTISSRSQDNLDAAAKDIGGDVEAHALDATSDAAVDAFFADGGPGGGTWDHVIASIGRGGRGRLPDMSMESAFEAMNAKFWPYFRIARAAQIAKDGSLTFVSGGLSRKPATAAALVCAVNGAVEAMTRGLALDMAPTRVNTLCPGTIDTPLWDQFSDEDRKAHYARTAEKLPVGRIGLPEDAGQAIVMLMTNPFATGTVLDLEGGSFLL